MKHAIVTGATSMIGIAVIEELLKTDIEKISAVVRRTSRNLYRIPKDRRISIVECEMDCYKELPKIIQDEGDVFYQISWNGNGTHRNDNVIEQSKNIQFIIEALHSAKAIHCKKFIAVGSQAEYGRLNLDKISPDSPTDPDTPYGIAKYASGKMAILEAERLNMDCFWVRVFSVYGKYDRESSMISYAINNMLAGKKTSFTPAEQEWDYLYSEDAGKALVLIGRYSHGRKVYCLGSGQKRHLYEYIMDIRNAVNPNLEVGIGDLPYGKNEVMSICADIRLLSEDVGWKPEISFKTGIKHMIDMAK